MESDFLMTTYVRSHKQHLSAAGVPAGGFWETFVTTEKPGCFQSDARTNRRRDIQGSADKKKEKSPGSKLWWSQPPSPPRTILSCRIHAMWRSLPLGRVATGTCRWWGNRTPPWSGVGLSSACGERTWDDSWSWAAAERWWWGRAPEEGSRLEEEERHDTVNKGTRAGRRQER